MGRRAIMLTVDELAALIRASRSHGALQVSRTTRGSALVAGEVPWAERLIAEWRGLTFTDGAGI